MNVDEIINRMTLEELSGQLMHSVAPIPRFHLRGYCYWSEGLHGVARAGLATVFPQSIALASTFNPALIKKMARAIGVEARVKFNQAIQVSNQVPIYQGLHIWSPVLNVFRDPRWGRGQETFGEDPCLIAAMGVAYVQGLQSKLDGIHPLADATIKHAFVHSGPEHQRKRFNATVDQDDLKQTYLRAFETVIKKGKPSGVMMAYNAVNGVPCVMNQKFTQELIQDKWGFKGYLVSDCGAVESMHQDHQVTSSMKESVLQTIQAGINLTCGYNRPEIRSYLDTGEDALSRIRLLLKPLLDSRQRLGIDNERPPYANLNETHLESKTHQNINLKLAEESIVLLENHGILPLSNSTYKLGVLGNNADNIYAHLGNYHGRPSKIVTAVEGLKQRFKNAHIRHAVGCQVDEIKSWLEQPFNEAKSIVDWADILILVLGIDARYEGEENDAVLSPLNGDKASLEYSASQMQLVHAALKSGKPVILVNISGSPMIIPKLPFAAVIQQFYGGSLAGKALANIISGRCIPSGKLPVSFPTTTSELPAFDNYDMSNRTYRYQDHPSAYSFGYGLTYGHCSIAAIKPMDTHWQVTLNNESKLKLKPTLQLYRLPLPSQKLNREMIYFKKINLKSRSSNQHYTIPYPRGKPSESTHDRWLISLNGPYDKEAKTIE
jgi:beta-glucosidase